MAVQLLTVTRGNYRDRAMCTGEALNKAGHLPKLRRRRIPASSHFDAALDFKVM